MKTYIKQVIADEAAAILRIPVTSDFEKCVELIYEQVHRKKGKLVASGMGKAGQIALNIATTLSSTGTPAVFLHPSDSQHGDLGVIQEKDILLLVSNSGKTREILELVNLAAAKAIASVKGNHIEQPLEMVESSAQDIVFYPAWSLGEEVHS